MQVTHLEHHCHGGLVFRANGEVGKTGMRRGGHGEEPGPQARRKDGGSEWKECRKELAAGRMPLTTEGQA